MKEPSKLRVIALRQSSNEDINTLWEKHGCLSLGDFANMRWSISSGDKWNSINNFGGINAPSNFKIYFDKEESFDDISRIRCEKIAVIVASECDALKNTSINSKKPVSDQEVFNAMINISGTDKEYNSPADPMFVGDYTTLHNLCINKNLCHNLHYDPAYSVWYIEINDCSKHCKYSGTFNLLSSVIRNAISYINTYR